MPEPRLTPEQDAQLRRLLAAARHDEPIPDDVAQRLDRVLAGLRTEASATTGPVADLGAARDRARRRRTTTQLLLAAAVVVVAGVGIGHAVSRDGGSDDSSADSSRVVDRGSSGGSALSSGSAEGVSPSAPAPAGTSGTTRPVLPLTQFRERLPVPLSSARLGRDVRRVAALAARARLQPGVAEIRTPVAGWSCAGTFTVTGDADLALPARYDGRPALLVLSPTELGRQKAQVLACGTFEVLRRVVVAGS